MNHAGDPVATADEFHDDLDGLRTVDPYASPRWLSWLVYGTLTLCAAAVLGLCVYVYIGAPA